MVLIYALEAGAEIFERILGQEDLVFLDLFTFRS